MAIGLALIAAPVFLSPPAAASQDDVEQVLAECEELMKRSPPVYHIQSYEALAKANDPRAIAVLREIYAKPRFPKTQTPFLIASALGSKGVVDGVLDDLAAWLEEADEPSDAWLWKNILKVEMDEWGPDRALEIARTAKDVVHRAAAIEALAAEKEESLYELIPELCKELPKKDVEKMVLTGAMVTALAELGNKKTQVKDDWQKMALALIATMEEGKTPRAAQLMIARQLADELDAERLVLEPDAWRSLIAQRAREAKEKKKKKKKKKDSTAGESAAVWPTFFGVEVTGDRVCYLIDLSDSMATPIPADWKPKNGPVSGPKKRKKLKKGEIPTEADIPWYSVETRFDLAREHLRISILRMTPDQMFTVVGFGSNAKFLDGCKGMVKATPSNVKKVLKGLDDIEIGKPITGRPNGVLWGDTNLFDGLRLAFAASKKGSVDEAAYVSYESMEHGADTILLLSDGNPSVDNFTVKDVDYGDGIVLSDVETGKEALDRPGSLDYMGPYKYWLNIFEETKRMNMLRQAQIHVISVGDGDRGALQQLAKIGLGKLTELGKQ